MLGVAEIGGVKGENEFGRVLDRRDRLPGAAAVPRPARDPDPPLEQAPLRDAQL